MIRCVAASLIAFAPALASAGEVLDAIKSRGELRVGTTGDYKPFSFRAPDGSYSGADIGMARELADALGVRVVFVPTAWGRILDDFRADKFDIAVGGISVLPARAAVGDFTPALRVDGKRPVARCADRERYTSVAAIDQPDVRVVVNPGASNEQFARSNFPHAQLTIHPDNPTVSDEIAAGRADVFVTDGIEVDHIALTHPGLCATAVPQPFTHGEQAYWMQRDPAFEQAVDRWLQGELTSGDWQKKLDTALKEP
ncbi:MAG: transporter substrate-binding domain-containing protein [Acetobacteraceae bacterium]|nr:transporter substrate-binding domain-containing protein [Acetobacteraceae bacterium]